MILVYYNKIGDSMFDENKGIIELDKILKQEYNYAYDGNLNNFYEQKFVELEGNGVDALYWIKIKEERFLLKNARNFKTDIWGELLSEEVSKHFNLPCAEYRVVRLGSWQGLITKDIIKKNETLILGSEIFQRFLNTTVGEEMMQSIVSYLPKEILKGSAFEQKKYIFTYLNNLKESSQIIMNSNYLTKEEKENIANFMLKMLLFDLLTLEWDRHPNNWGILKTEQGYIPSPLFDNSTSFGLGLPNMEEEMIRFKEEHLNYRFFKDDEQMKKMVYRGSARFAFSKEDIVDIRKKEKLPGDKVFENLLANISDDKKEEVYKMISSIDSTFIDDIISKVEETNGIKMDDTTYYYISNIFNENLKYLKEIVSMYQRSSSSNYEKTR